MIIVRSHVESTASIEKAREVATTHTIHQIEYTVAALVHKRQTSQMEHGEWLCQLGARSSVLYRYIIRIYLRVYYEVIFKYSAVSNRQYLP